jgi:hypothetical protein
MNKKIVLLAVSAILLLLTGCGIPFQRKLDMYMTAGQYKEADALIDSEKTHPKENIYNDKNELLYFFDKGAVLQMGMEYGRSTDFLEKADDRIDKLYTRSVVNEVGSFLSNDLALDYTGEDFEQTMVEILKALNYMYAGDFDNARVEIKRVNNRLNVFADKYGDKAIYTDDAFARYISAFAYEALGEINDSYIDYKKSLKAYEKYNKFYGTEIPPFIKQDVLRTADALHFDSDIAEFTNQWGKVDFVPSNRLKEKGEVLVVVYDGLPAYKIDDNKWPKFIDRGNALADVRAVAGGTEYQGFVSQDVSRMAIKNLETKNMQILAKKVGSSLVKGLAKNFPVLNLFVTEDKADTRSWRTIPARFHIIRMALAPGKQVISVELFPASGGDLRVEKVSVDVKKGKKIVVPVFSYSAMPTAPVVEEK